MADLVDQHGAHATRHVLGAGAEPHDRDPVERDRVREGARGAAVVRGPRDAAVEAEQQGARTAFGLGLLVLDEHGDLADDGQHPVGQRVERVDDHRLEGLERHLRGIHVPSIRRVSRSVR